MTTDNCESCETIGETTVATTQRNGEHVCEDCAADIDSREGEQQEIRETVYDERGISKLEREGK